MAIRTLYTAVGRFEHRGNRNGHLCPVIVLGSKEYMVDIQEMVIWTSLNWRISKKEDIEKLYRKTVGDTALSGVRPPDACIERLLTRGLLVSGSGNTEYDALYDLISTMYIIPATGNLPLRLLSFLKLTVLERIPFSAAKNLFRKDIRTADEERVIGLAKQALLSTAEIIKCMDKGIHRLPCEESILHELYDDSDTTSDNIASMVKSSQSSQAVILAVANLYLRQQIIFERI